MERKSLVNMVRIVEVNKKQGFWLENAACFLNDSSLSTEHRKPENSLYHEVDGIVFVFCLRM